MAEGDSPTVARRRVRLAIREARERQGLTQIQVAEEMEWSLSKVIRIESGEVSISVNDLRPLLTFIGIRERSYVNSLLADARLARQRQRKEWYQRPEYREYMSDPLRRLTEYEAEATAMRSYSVYYPPGPFQTPEYAAALTSGWDHELPVEYARAMVEVRRLRRESLLARLENVDVSMVLDQSVFERTLGGRAVLAAQLRNMHDLATSGLIKIRMLAFDLDSPIANNGSFDLLTIPGGPGGDVMYRENGTSDELLEDPAVTARHRIRFERLWQVATEEVDTIEFLKRRLDTLENKITDNRRRG